MTMYENWECLFCGKAGYMFVHCDPGTPWQAMCNNCGFCGPEKKTRKAAREAVEHIQAIVETSR